MSILFLNHKAKQCGVYQYGKRVFDILVNSLNISYKEVENENEYNYIYNNQQTIIYNYHAATMSWLNINNINKRSLNISIQHESDSKIFDIYLSIDPNSLETENNFSIPRPIFENLDLDNYIPNNDVKSFIDYKELDVPIFGSFGFGFNFKGFHKIVKLINEQYDKAIIKFVIPLSHFDSDTNTVYKMEQLCHNENKKDGIKLLITHDFFSEMDILKFLYSNTMNIFLYDELPGRGISSAIDYAISVKKPLGISNSYMFRNIYSDEICLGKRSIQQVFNNSLEYCSQFLEKYSNKNLINKIQKIINENIYRKSTSHSQSGQDLFALKHSKFKTFLDIGSEHPIIMNNTYLLAENGWTGIMIEYVKSFEPLYKQHRQESIHVLEDARTIDYRRLLDSLNFPIDIGYLQIDLDVDNRSTLDTLELLDKTVFDKYRFATITFEHDIYTGNFFDTQRISREIFAKRGYVLIKPNVKVFFSGEYREYEDWYIHPELCMNL